MKVLVYTGFNDDKLFKEIGALTSPSKLAYAIEHGYDFKCSRNFEGHDRHVSWFKIRRVLGLLPLYDWIFWTDADSLIMDQHVTVQNLIDCVVDRPAEILLSHNKAPAPVLVPPLKEVDYIVSDGECSPCMGNFLIRNCQWSFDFLGRIWDNEDHFHGGLYDQGAQDDIFATDPEAMTHVKFLPKRILTPGFHEYRKGDFMVHVSGCDSLLKYCLLDKYVSEVKSAEKSTFIRVRPKTEI